MNIVLDSSCKLNIQCNSPELKAPFDHVYHTQLPLFVLKKMLRRSTAQRYASMESTPWKH
jgi:hypothetical protein